MLRKPRMPLLDRLWFTTAPHLRCVHAYVIHGPALADRNQALPHCIKSVNVGDDCVDGRRCPMNSCSLHRPSCPRRVWNGKCGQLHTRPRSPPNINAATATVGCCCRQYRHSATMPQPQCLDAPHFGNSPAKRRWKASPGAPHRPTTLTWRRYHGSAQEIRPWGALLQVANGVALPPTTRPQETHHGRTRSHA